tara:strand:+ start:234 stop:959 length:726 start_codon:yes stop_codon:yes gene_type:complete
MGRSKDIATSAKGDADYVNVSGDTMTGNLTTTGHVGVGTSNPIGDLSVVDSSSGSGMEFQPEVTTDTNRLTNYDRVDSAYKKFRLDASEQQFYISGTERMNIDGSGRMTLPNQPSFAAFRDAGHVTASGTVYVFDHTIYNVGNMYNTSNGRATVPVSGKYLLSIWLMTTNSTANNKYYYIAKNGGHYRRVYSSNGGNVHHQQSWTGIISLNANDYIEIINHNAGLYGTSSYYCHFNMHLLS